MAENKRNRKSVKCDRKRLFNQRVYKDRFMSERSFVLINLPHLLVLHV